MQPHAPHRRLALAIGRTLVGVLVLCLVATRATADGPTPLPADATSQQLTERILALQQEIDELLARLPAHIRQELEVQLSQRTAGAPKATTASAATADPKPATTTTKPAEPLVEPAATITATTSTPTTATATPVTAAPATATPPANSGIPVLKPRPGRVTCNTLVPLDENGDGRISAADRHWRHLYLWTDKNGDGQRQEKEIGSAYDRGVREISTTVETFIRTKGNLGEIRVKDNVVLDLRGDGFSERARQDDGVLLIDASAVARGDGPKILDDRGSVLADLQPFRAGLQIRHADQVTPLSCP